MPVAASVAAASDSEEEDDGQEPGARVDGRRENRGRKARSTILLAEKLRWIGRVEAQLLLTPAPAHSHSLKDGRLARAVRATLEAHDKPSKFVLISMKSTLQQRPAWPSFWSE